MNIQFPRQARHSVRLRKLCFLANRMCFDNVLIASVLQNGSFCSLKKAISACEMGHIGMRKGSYCKTQSLSLIFDTFFAVYGSSWGCVAAMAATEYLCVWADCGDGRLCHSAVLLSGCFYVATCGCFQINCYLCLQICHSH